jgi:hypothetical protein
VSLSRPTKKEGQALCTYAGNVIPLPRPRPAIFSRFLWDYVECVPVWKRWVTGKEGSEIIRRFKKKDKRKRDGFMFKTAC